MSDLRQIAEVTRLLGRFLAGSTNHPPEPYVHRGQVGPWPRPGTASGRSTALCRVEPPTLAATLSWAIALEARTEVSPTPGGRNRQKRHDGHRPVRVPAEQPTSGPRSPRALRYLCLSGGLARAAAATGLKERTEVP